MPTLDNHKPNSQVKDILPNDTVNILSMQWHDSDVVEVSYRGATENFGNNLISRNREADLEVTAPGKAWAFDANPVMFRLISEADRIRMANLFDLWLAIHLAQVEPLPHPITAVNWEMRSHQPLRFYRPMIPVSAKQC
jgi:hypothetical protein